jgi:HAD superfamily hydrolase (TIGR01549 family)
MDASRDNLHSALVAEGFDVAKDAFLKAYTVAHEKYRKVRYEQFREVTNAVWVAEALCNVGFQVSADDYRVQAALNVFFQDFIDTLEIRAGANKLIKQAHQQYKVGLISNFTYAPVIYKSLRHLHLNDYFHAVVVSEEHGWRKPSPHIFQDALNKLQVQAHEAAFIGDSPIEDIKGAKDAGLKTIFVASQFNTLKNLAESKQQPNYTAKNLKLITEKLDQILST